MIGLLSSPNTPRVVPFETIHSPSSFELLELEAAEVRNAHVVGNRSDIPGNLELVKCLVLSHANDGGGPGRRRGEGKDEGQQVVSNHHLGLCV